MARRAGVVERISELVGEDALRITSVALGWPALGELIVDGSPVPVALFVAPIGLSHRNRDDVERRFQNPGSDRPIIEIPDRESLLLGLWEDDEHEQVQRPLLVSADPRIRFDRRTRFSVFVGVGALREGLDRGWSEGQSSTGESSRCFVPPLLPLSYAADRDQAVPPTAAMQVAIAGSGLIAPGDDATPAAARRARRAGSLLVRDARFSRGVIAAYGGLCAMCGLAVGLVEGAHIYPVSAPGSCDEPWNGLALCANHHLAFDKHLVGVDIVTSKVVIHEDVRQQAPKSAAVRAFVDGTYPRLAPPSERSARPRAEMFELRYAFYLDRYNWLLDS